MSPTTRDDAESKPKGLTHPRVTLIPGLRGVRVIEGENGAEPLRGELFPWYRVIMQGGQGGSSVWLRDRDGRPLKVQRRQVWASMKNRANAAQRAQQRHILAWARASDEPISFEPRESSLWGFLLVLALVAPGIVYLYVGVLMQFQHFPPQNAADWAAVMQLIVLSAIAGLMGWVMSMFRPRAQRFERVDLLPIGLVGTLRSGEVVSIDFDERARPRLHRGDPLRLAFTAAGNERMSIAVPRPVSNYLRTALNPPKETQAESRRAMSRRFFWMGLRVIVIGIVVVLGFYLLVGWLSRIGWILPQDALAIQRRTPFAVGFPLVFGLQIMYVSWKHSNHGIRTISRLARWLERRKKRGGDRDAAPGKAS